MLRRLRHPHLPRRRGRVAIQRLRNARRAGGGVGLQGAACRRVIESAAAEVHQARIRIRRLRQGVGQGGGQGVAQDAAVTIVEDAAGRGAAFIGEGEGCAAGVIQGVV